MGSFSSLAYDVNANKIKRIQEGKKQKIAFLLPEGVIINGHENYILFEKYDDYGNLGEYNYHVLLAAINLGLNEVPKNENYNDDCAQDSFHENLRFKGINFELGDFCCQFNNRLKYPMKMVIVNNVSDIPKYEDLNGFVSIGDTEQGCVDEYLSKEVLIKNANYSLLNLEFNEDVFSQQSYDKFINFCNKLDY